MPLFLAEHIEINAVGKKGREWTQLRLTKSFVVSGSLGVIVFEQDVAERCFGWKGYTQR